MIRLRWPFLLAVGWLALSAAPVRAQRIFIGPGSTFQGDYFRGVGVGALGMGSFNLNTARSERLHVGTQILLNEYIANVLKNENREAAQRRMARLERHKAAREEIYDRIHKNPELVDVMNGDALNALMAQLQSPSLADSEFASYNVPLDADTLKRIPFKLGERGATFSLARLNLRKSWTVALQDQSFARLRDAFQAKVEQALDLAIEGKMQQEMLNELERAVADLDQKLIRSPELLEDRSRKQAGEARKQIDQLKAMVELFKIRKIQDVMAEVEKGFASNVDELRLFMRKHNLSFAPAETLEERALYPRLFTAMKMQRDRSAPQGQQQNGGRKREEKLGPEDEQRRLQEQLFGGAQPQ